MNVTWLQDANLAASNTFGITGIQSTGAMDWNTAQNWIAAMNASNYQGFNNWRLPNVKPINGVEFNYGWRYGYDINTGADGWIQNIYDGQSDWGYNISSPNSELAYMYHVNLGNTGRYSASSLSNFMPILENSSWNAVPKADNTALWFDDGGQVYDITQGDHVTFSNLQSYVYWTGVSYPDANGTAAWSFHNYDGSQMA